MWLFRRGRGGTLERSCFTIPSSYAFRDEVANVPRSCFRGCLRPYNFVYSCILAYSYSSIILAIQCYSILPLIVMITIVMMTMLASSTPRFQHYGSVGKSCVSGLGFMVQGGLGDRTIQSTGPKTLGEVP